MLLALAVLLGTVGFVGLVAALEILSRSGNRS